MYDGSLKAVNIKTSEYERRYHVNDKVFNLTLEVEVSYNDNLIVLTHSFKVFLSHVIVWSNGCIPYSFQFHS